MNTKVGFPQAELPRPEVSTPPSLNSGGFVEIEGESYYKIERVDHLDPFLINLVSPNNHWMFIASNGALTAGRRDADNALFSYCTQDKLFELAHTVGSQSLLWINRSSFSAPILWELFRKRIEGEVTQTNLYKNAEGNRLIFEELNYELGVSFRYLWTFSERYGFVRRAYVENLAGESVKIRILDGIQNLVPYGLNQAFVNRFSNLADGYKKCELLASENLGIFYLSSIPTDRAEPSEGLRATVVWSHGVKASSTLLSARQLDRFRKGEALQTECDKRGVRGAYFIEADIELKSGDKKDWWIVADINQDACQVESLRRSIESDPIVDLLQRDVLKNVSDLRSKVATADGLSMTSNKLRDNRHYSNALFNIMRGGVFYNGYTVELADFVDYLESRNKVVTSGSSDQLAALRKSDSSTSYGQLIEWAEESGDSNLVRLATEYLPLTFSRRHGDPSRPWNRFSIDTQDKYGKPILAYEGNWRDIFQNWEALAYSFPSYVKGMIMRFLNSSTADGYNPYRISRDNIDWEVIEPDSPWSNIGYWGDHQIVYLLKLLETSERFEPSYLKAKLDSDDFVYANVPYRIRSFAEIWRNPRETVDFSDEEAQLIEDRCASVGSDGKLLASDHGQIHKANLIEKLLNPLLSKLSNFIPDAGIWMNTQRPEWNDANNALVGYGVSVVTLCYVNRYIAFLLKLLESESEDRVFLLNESVVDFLSAQRGEFKRFEAQLAKGFDASSRMKMVQTLGESGEAFRKELYKDGMTGERKSVSNQDIVDFLGLAKRYVEASVDANCRPEGMYHSYNLIDATGDDGINIDRLPVMLEGQVAVLSSGHLNATKAIALLDALRDSPLYRQDAQSYMLYPDRELPTFLEKNRVAEEAVKGSRLLMEMIDRKDPRIIQHDCRGQYRFSGDFRNSGDLRVELAKVGEDYPDLMSEEEISLIVSIFENTFDHRRFTGRSSTFFAYEGLGSIYWHMVSKLVLAIQENWLAAVEDPSGSETTDLLAKHYFETFRGLGLYRTPREYGAFPVDAYSHTPKHAGAQQPGMTGQVKEDLITRWGELGLNIVAGRIHFVPKLLPRSDFLDRDATFHFLGSDNRVLSKSLQADQLAFTCCQSLIVYQVGAGSQIQIKKADGSECSRDDAALTREESRAIFSRDGSISEIVVTIPEHLLYQGESA